MGQVQLKLGDLRSSLANFEKVLEVHPESCEAVKVSWYLIQYFVGTDYCQHFIIIKKLDNYSGHCFKFWLLSTFCFCYLNSLSFSFFAGSCTHLCAAWPGREGSGIFEESHKNWSSWSPGIFMCIMHLKKCQSLSEWLNKYQLTNQSSTNN